jgi:hypothetical protein
MNSCSNLMTALRMAFSMWRPILIETGIFLPVASPVQDYRGAPLLEQGLSVLYQTNPAV